MPKIIVLQDSEGNEVGPSAAAARGVSAFAEALGWGLCWVLSYKWVQDKGLPLRSSQEISRDTQVSGAFYFLIEMDWKWGRGRRAGLAHELEANPAGKKTLEDSREGRGGQLQSQEFSVHCGCQEPPTGHVEAVQVLLRGQGEQQPWNTPVSMFPST